MNKILMIIAGALVTSMLPMLHIPAADVTAQSEGRAMTESELTADMTLGEEGRTFYISSSLGLDSNSGDSEDYPWESFANINSMDLRAGDKVLLMRGDSWNERLVIHGSGSEDNWIFVGSYGDADSPQPRITLNNGRDDIGILATDIPADSENEFGLNYIWIDNIEITNSFLGIYFRYDASVDNKGVRVTNCNFYNINCPELMQEALTDMSFLGAAKGELDDLVGGNIVSGAGGAYEYVWPCAINIGGRPEKPLANVEIPGVAGPATVVSEIELIQNSFERCVVAVGANCYHYHYGTGSNQFRGYTKNWRVSGLVSVDTMTMFNIDSADFGYDSDIGESGWGYWSNNHAKSGMADHTMSAGTTQALFSSCENLYIKNSSFNGCKNNGQPDGCGFDFERDVHNFTLDSCIIANNDGQGVLVMQTTMQNQVTGENETTPNTNNVIKNCVFYNNMTNVYGSQYRFDITVFNDNNQNFEVSDCAFYFRRYTAGRAEEGINIITDGEYSPVGVITEGFTLARNRFFCMDRMPELSTVIEKLKMQESVVEYAPADKIWSDYIPKSQPDDGDDSTESESESKKETEGEVVTEATEERVSETESEAKIESENETEARSESGCGSFMGGATILATVLAAGLAFFGKRFSLI